MSSVASTYGDPRTRRRILDATWELLETRGGSFTLAEAAAASGVSRQTLYLHFGDRSGLLIAVVDHIDLSLGSTQLRARVFGAPTGVEALRRWVETMSWYTEKIDGVSRVLEQGQHEDASIAAAWRNRMDRRRNDIIRTIVERMAAEGQLAKGWSVDAATDLIYVITMPGPWRELTAELGWTPARYSRHLVALLKTGLVAEARPHT